MCAPTRWLTKGAFMTLAVFLSFANRTSRAEEASWQKAIRGVSNFSCSDVTPKPSRFIT